MENYRNQQITKTSLVINFVSLSRINIIVISNANQFKH